MKRLTSYLIASALVFSSVSVFAADTSLGTQDVFNNPDKSITVGDIADSSANRLTDYTTVVIREKDTTEDDKVVYINQQSAGFADATKFLLKDGASGNFVATFGNAAGDTKTLEFAAGTFGIKGETDGGSATDNNAVSLDSATKMTVLDEPTTYGKDENGNDLYVKGFQFSVGNKQPTYNRVYLVAEDLSVCYGYIDFELPNLTIGDATIQYGIQIFNIPEEKIGLNIYLGETPKEEVQP